MSGKTPAADLDRVELTQGPITYRAAGPADSAYPPVVFPHSEFDGLIKVGSHAWLIKPMLTALRLTALRHAKSVYGGTFAGTPDPRVTRSWIQPGLSNKRIRRDTAKLTLTTVPSGHTFISMEFPEQVADAITETCGDQ